MELRGFNQVFSSVCFLCHTALPHSSRSTRHGQKNRRGDNDTGESLAYELGPLPELFALVLPLQGAHQLSPLGGGERRRQWLACGVVGWLCIYMDELVCGFIGGWIKRMGGCYYEWIVVWMGYWMHALLVLVHTCHAMPS